MTFEKVSDNGILLYGLDIFRFQICIHELKLDMPKKYSCWRTYQTMAFEKVSDNGILLYGLDILDSIIHLNWFCQKTTPIG